jgi:hypothetical protein
MDSVTTSQSRAERIRRYIDLYGLTEDEAIFFVDLADGKHKGDVVGLTDEERRRMGLDHSALDDLDSDWEAPTSAATGVAPAADRSPGT